MCEKTFKTFPEFIFAHTKYELWLANREPYLMKTACDLFNSYMINLSEMILPMAKKQAQNNQQQWAKIEFVNINLSKQEKTQFKSWYTEIQAELPRLVAVFIAAGYKQSIKWDNENDCFIATATCVDDSLENSGKALSSRSDDWMEAIALNVFKTDVLSEKGVWEASGKGNSWG